MPSFPWQICSSHQLPYWTSLLHAASCARYGLVSILTVRGRDIGQWHSTLWQSFFIIWVTCILFSNHAVVSSSSPCNNTMSGDAEWEQPDMRTATFWMCSGAGMRPSVGSWSWWAWTTGSWHTPGPGTRARGRWTGLWTLRMMPWRPRPGLAMPAWRMCACACMLDYWWGHHWHWLCPAFPPMVDNGAMEKHTAGSTALAIFDAPPMFLIISSCSTSNTFQSLCSGGMCSEIHNVHPEPRPGQHRPLAWSWWAPV